MKDYYNKYFAMAVIITDRILLWIAVLWAIGVIDRVVG